MLHRNYLSATAATLLVALSAACGSSPPEKPSLGPPAPSGAIVLPGEPRQQLPVPASPKVPTSQQEAQDNVLRYLQMTVDALPKGTNYCQDNPSGPDAPVHFEDWRDMKPPPGADFAEIITQTREIWKKWGWRVIERDGFSKPNRFGYASGGYVLQIEARPDPNQPPSLIGSSPCYPGNLRNDETSRPPLIQQQG